MNRNIQNAIISTFLFLDSLGYEESELFELNPILFDTPLQKRIIEKINEELKKDFKAFDLLGINIESAVANTKFAQEFIEILGANPITLKMAKRYLEELYDRKRLEIINNIRR